MKYAFGIIAAVAVGVLPMAAAQVDQPIDEPAPVSAVFDGSGGFSALNGTTDVEVFEKGGRAYAIVAAGWDDGVQIMDITNPAHPSPVSAVFDGSGGFSALDGAADVELFETGGRAYAIVTTEYDGVQIIDITNPVHPSPASAVFDDSGGFSALDGAYDVEVFEKGGRAYAIVAAVWDDGVQIIDITNPVHPSPASAVFDDSGGFSALGEAADVEVFEKGGRAYAIVAAAYGGDGGGVQIMDITNPIHPSPVSAVFDGSGGFSALDGAADVELFETGGRAYAIVAATVDDGVQIMDITNPVHPSPVSAVFDDSGGFSALDGAWDVELFEKGGRAYAIVAAAYGYVVGGEVQIMDITNPIQPTPISAVFDDSGGFSALDGAYDVEVFEKGGRAYAIVAAIRDEGVQIIDITLSRLAYLDVTADITGYERTNHGSRDFVQVTTSITNHEFVTLTNDDQNGVPVYGELHVSLNAIGDTYHYVDTSPSCDATRGHCVWSNGDYVAYNDMTRSQAQSRGVDVSEEDCTAWDRWSIPRGETREIRFCYWVDRNFEPESLQLYQPGADRIQTIPFLHHGSCYLPYMQCNEAALTLLPEGYTPESPAFPLTHAIYDSSSARLMLVFSEPVVIRGQGGMELIHDVGAYIENGTAATLADPEPHTVDGRSGSSILAFDIGNNTHAGILESDDVRLAIDSGAIFASDGFADITAHEDDVPVIIRVLVLR